MSPTFALCLVGGFLALAWLAHEYRTAPIIEDDTGPDPWLAEDVRAALNSVEGYPIPSGASLPRTGPGAAHSPHDRGGAGNTPSLSPLSHSSINTHGAQQDHVA